jgi:hypothetical protein
MTDVAYLCHNCGSVHEVESIRENLMLDLRAAASYGPSGQRGMTDPRARFLRWRMAWGLAQALWPRYSHRRCLAWARRLVQGPPRTTSWSLRLVSNLAIPASCGPAPHQAPEPSDHGEQESQHSGQQERDPKRLVPMAAEVADFHVLAVFEDEDQQQQQDDGK